MYEVSPSASNAAICFISTNSIDPHELLSSCQKSVIPSFSQTPLGVTNKRKGDFQDLDTLPPKYKNEIRNIVRICGSLLSFPPL